MCNILKIIIFCIFSVFQAKASTWIDQMPKNFISEAENYHRNFFIQTISTIFGTELGSEPGSQEFSSKDKLDNINAIINLYRKGGISKKDFDINLPDSAGMNALHYLSITKIRSKSDEKNIYDICKIFLNLDANINKKNEFGISPLELAANYGNSAVVKAFVESKKLKKDFNVLSKLFLPDLFDPDIIDMNYITKGRIKIFNELINNWVPSVSATELSDINLNLTKLQKWINLPRFSIQSDEFEKWINMPENKSLLINFANWNLTKIANQKPTSKTKNIYIDFKIWQKEKIQFYSNAAYSSINELLLNLKKEMFPRKDKLLLSLKESSKDICDTQNITNEYSDFEDIDLRFPSYIEKSSKPSKR